MKKHTLYSLLIAASFLSACDQSQQVTKEQPAEKEKIAIGTDIKTLTNPESQDAAEDKPKSVANTKDKNGYQEITWQDLEIKGMGMDSILEKFDKEIDAIPEGSLKEKEMLGRLQASLNAAPVNPELDKKKIKLAGFVSPIEIDEKEGMVKEFLLVPYFGACIHVPPPPLNQTLYIKPPKDQQISLEDSYDPVWVSGVIHADSTVTKLAEAGYKISDVKIEPYEEKAPE